MSQYKRILVALDGSKPSLRGLDRAIDLAKQSGGTIIGISIDTTFGLFTAVHNIPLKESKWTDKIWRIMQKAGAIAKKRRVKFQPVVIAGRAAGYDITTYANNPRNKIDAIVIGARGGAFPKEIFFGSTSSFVLHKAKAPVILVK